MDVSIDVCMTSTLHSHLLHHMSRRSISVSLCLKHHSYPVVTPTMIKRNSYDEHTKPLFLCVNTKVYSQLYFLVVVEKRETAYVKWVALFSKTDKWSVMKRKTESRHRP